MANTQSDTLSRAIDALGAVEVAPGRYAYRSEAVNAYVIAEVDDDGYVWETAVMPAWWTPERRTIHKGNGHYIITADLETGEEVSA
jgi:hypothetical protein